MTGISQTCTQLRQIALSNLLSFGPDMEPLVLENLNILIGPNAAGKSNLIEAIALMRAAPGDMGRAMRPGVGVSEWIWKGGKGSPACIDLVMENPRGRQPLRHVLSFRDEAMRFLLHDERIENEIGYENEDVPYFYYRFNRGHPMVNTIQGERRALAHETVDDDRSILAQRRDPEGYPELSYLADVYEKIRIYREWVFGRNAVFREPQKADMRNDRLEEDFSNLGLFLNRLRRTPKAKAAILESLFTEGDFVIPATRLSDGTLRYLCLLAILLDPSPPPLICIEEPELGLHPDILPKLVDLVVAASERTQLIVTTHSDILVDAMTERPEAVVVCEKHDGKTQFRRLSKDELGVWLNKYRLGELWTKGQIGGTRW